MVPRRRVWCEQCGGLRLDKLSWLGRYQPVTDRLAQAVSQLLASSKILAVARFFQLGWHTVKALDKAGCAGWSKNRTGARSTIWRYPSGRGGAQQLQPQGGGARARALADYRFAWPVRSQCQAAGERIRPQDADRIVLPRPQVPPLWSRLRGQPDAQRYAPAVLLLVGTLASFASWLAGLACKASDMARWLWPTSTKRKLYSTLRVGWKALAKCWPMESVFRWLECLRSLPPDVLDQAVLTA